MTSVQPMRYREPGAPRRAVATLVEMFRQIGRNLRCWWSGHSWERTFVGFVGSKGPPVGVRERCRRGCDVFDRFDGLNDVERQQIKTATRVGAR